VPLRVGLSRQSCTANFRSSFNKPLTSSSLGCLKSAKTFLSPRRLLARRSGTRGFHPNYGRKCLPSVVVITSSHLRLGSVHRAPEHRALPPAASQGDRRGQKAAAAAPACRRRDQAQSGRATPEERAPLVLQILPRPPVRRVDFDTPVGLRLDPAAEDATAGERQRVQPIGVDDRNFERPVERS